MSATATDTNSELRGALTGSKTNENAQKIYDTLGVKMGLPETPIGEGSVGIPLSKLQERLYESDKEAPAGEETLAERMFGTKNPFLAASAAGPGYQQGSIKQVDAMIDHEKGVIDQSVVGAASPVSVDPQFVEVQRSAAPVLSVIQQVMQAGFTAQYNVISDRSDPIGMVSESEAVDLSALAEGDFTLQTATKDMKIFVDQVNISDFSQRAEQSLGFMDLTQMTLGQRFIAYTLFKAKQIFYGDPSVNAGDKSVEDADAYEGLAKIATDAGNTLDKSTVAAGFLNDLLDELTVEVENTGLTYDRAHFLVSPAMYNALYQEATPVVRIDGYDAPVNYGPGRIEIDGVTVTRCPNIRNYAGLSGTNFVSDNGDVFLIDDAAVQFRSLAPYSSIPLGRVGLADKAAMFEYGTLIDKSHGAHLTYLSGYDI